MSHIKLPSPVVKAIQDTPCTEPSTHQNSSQLPFPGPTAADFFDVVDRRRTRRRFGPIQLETLSSFLWFSARSREVVQNNGSIIWESRPAPSAGGKHPIDLYLFPHHQPALKYNPYSHVLHEILDFSSQSIESLIRDSNLVVDRQDGVLIWMIANFQKTASKYDNPESLVWRDAGALLNQMSLVAEALHLNYCPIGITGEPYCSTLLGDGWYEGVGGFVLGSRSE